MTSNKLLIEATKFSKQMSSKFDFKKLDKDSKKKLRSIIGKDKITKADVLAFFGTEVLPISSIFS